MDVFIIEEEVGEYEDRDRRIRYAGSDKDIAYKKATVKYSSTSDVNKVFFSIWRNGEQIAGIMRDVVSDEWEKNFNSANVFEFQIFGIYFNSEGKQVSPMTVKTTVEIRNEINKVFRKQCTVEQLTETIARIHQLLLNEGFK